jgi:transcriptional regulator with XRE-family HTH domain
MGLSQTELAQKINKTSAAYIAFIEAGKRNLSTMDLMLLAKNLDTTVSSLIGEQKEDKNAKILQVLRSSDELSPEDAKLMEEFYNRLKERNNKNDDK